MIRLTFSPEFPRRTVEVEEISGGDRGRDFGALPYFPALGMATLVALLVDIIQVKRRAG